MNNKGFTLVEVLAMLVVLGILMAVSIPNITGIVNQHKTNVIKSDVTKMVNAAKIKMVTDENVKKPGLNQCIVFSLKYLNYNDDIGSGPHDGKYSDYDSFVVVKREQKRYRYFVRLVEVLANGDYYGVEGIDYLTIDPDKTSYIKEITEFYNLDSIDNAADKYDDSDISLISSNCPDGITYKK